MSSFKIVSTLYLFKYNIFYLLDSNEYDQFSILRYQRNFLKQYYFSFGMPSYGLQNKFVLEKLPYFTYHLQLFKIFQ